MADHDSISRKPPKSVRRVCVGCGTEFSVTAAHKNQQFHDHDCYVMHRASQRPPVDDLFWSKVEKLDQGCWLWRGGINKGGYGVFRKSPRRDVLAHRHSWEMVHGQIPEGMFVCHHCDNPPCVNPSHLFVGSAADNSADMVNKGRESRQGGPQGPRPQWWMDRMSRGEAHHQAKLTVATVQQIRSRKESGERAADLAREFGISLSTTKDIIRRKTWRHVP